MVKNLSANAGDIRDVGYITGLGRPPGGGFPYSSVGKEFPAMQETWVRFLDRDDPLEKEMATHSSILTCKTPWTEEPGRLQTMGSQELDTT